MAVGPTQEYKAAIWWAVVWRKYCSDHLATGCAFAKSQEESLTLIVHTDGLLQLLRHCRLHRRDRATSRSVSVRSTEDQTSEYCTDHYTVSGGIPVVVDRMDASSGMEDASGLLEYEERTGDEARRFRVDRRCGGCRRWW